MKVNQTPVRTSKNYGINCFDIPSDVLNYKIKEFKNYSLKNFEDCKIKTDNSNQPLKPLSEELNDELKNTNLNLKIQIKQSKNKERLLNLNLDDKVVGKVVFEIAKNVKAKIIINVKAKEGSLHNGFIKFVCEENSCVDVTFVCDFEKAVCNLLCLENLVKENAKLDYKFIDFAANYSVVNFYSQLYDNSQCFLKNIYVGDNNNKIDLNLFQDVFGKNSFAKIDTVGALLDESEKNFKGTISFNKGAKQSMGEENELCILLSNNAKAKALPMLLCAEEDVDGNHSSAIGKINNKELFYLMSRGLSKTDAVKLLLKAKFNVVLDEMETELKDFVSCKIDRKIENEKL